MLELINSLGGLINSAFAIVIGLALLGFFWGLAKFIFRVGGDEKAVNSGKELMKWGVIALFVMLSVWGLVAFMQRAFGLNTLQPPSGSGGYTSPSDFYPTPTDWRRS